MFIQILSNGNLEMELCNKERRAIKKWKDTQSYDAESRFIKTYLSGFGYKQIQPEEVGALTTAPLITDGKDVWGHMDYQIHSFILELMAGEKVEWQKG